MFDTFAAKGLGPKVTLNVVVAMLDMGPKLAVSSNQALDALRQLQY